MQEINTLLVQISVMLLMALIGYISGKTGYLPENTASYLSKTVIRITESALILSTMTAYDFDAQTLSDGLYVAVFAFIFMLLSLLIGVIIARLLKLKSESSNVFAAHLMFGNVGYLALPLLKAVFDDKAVVLAAFYIMVFNLFMWTIGLYMLDKNREFSLKRVLKKFINTNTIACVIGLVFALLNLQQYIKADKTATLVYNIFYNTVSPIGNCTQPLVMLFIGLQFAENPSGGIVNLLKKPVTLVLSVLKLIAIPALALGIMLLLGDLVDPYVRTIVVMETAMPCGAIVAALSSEFGSDYQLATDNMIFTTVLSMFTLPIFTLLLSSL